MTSFAFILGVVPLVLAEGAGAEMRQALGTAVFSGMIGVTLFGIFLTPVFFSVIERISLWQIFSTGWLPRIGRGALQALRLEPVRRGIAHMSRRLGRAAISPKVAEPDSPTLAADQPQVITTHEVVLPLTEGIDAAQPIVVAAPGASAPCFAAQNTATQPLSEQSAAAE